MASVAMQHVSKQYDAGPPAVCDLNLHVDDGELLALVGPSGCGKTTTLRMIAGLESITSGTAMIGQRVVNDVAPRDRDVAMVFQNYALYPHLTVRKNLAFALKMRKTPREEIDRRVAWAAALLGLEPVLDRKPRALSGGQRQRVALGRAIVRKPEVYLLDEPLSNLDARLRVAMRAEIKRLHRKLKTTIIYVTHDQEEAMSLGDRVAVMHQGSLRQCDAPLTVYNRPADRFVAGFLGTPAMNFLEGTVELRDGQTWFVGHSVRWRIADPAERSPLAPESGPATAGVRPEAIELLVDAKASGENRLPATVVDVEPLGAWMDVHLRGEGMPNLLCRTRARPLSEGAAVACRIPAESIYLFPMETAGHAAAPVAS